MKAFKKYLLIILTGALMVLAAACGGTQPELSTTPPELTVTKTSVSGKVRESVALPDATAKDYLERDISEDIRIKIYFKEDEEFVLPQKNAALGVLLSQNKSFKPTKCGEYVVTYFVADEKDKEAEKDVTLTVSENPDDELGQNLASVNNTGNWLYGEDTQNSVLNDFGEITIAGVNDGSAALYGGASYKGQKIQNGDAVTVEFVAQPTKNVWFYDFAYLLTPSADADAPVAGEATWPKYFHIRILKNQVQPYLYTLSKNYTLCDFVSASLLDGAQHSLSLKIDADADKVDVSMWIDKAVTASPSAMNTIYKKDVIAHTDDPDALKVFDPEIKGWLSFGANITGSNLSKDGLVIKGVTVNGAADLKAPSVEVAPMERMLINTAVTLPAYTARDENDYSSLTSAVKLAIKSPNGQFEDYTDTTFTPAEAGEYIFRYTVTDRRGNLGYQDVRVFCSKGESTAAPVIDFGGDIEQSITVKLNEATSIPMPVSVTDCFGDDVSSRLTVELVGREKVDLKDATEVTFRAAGTNILRYRALDFNDVETVVDVTVNVTGGATGNLLEDDDDWYFYRSTYDEEADTLRIDQGGAQVVYGGQKIYDEKVSILWNYDVATLAGGADGTNILLINLRAGKSEETVKTNNNPDGGTSWGWPEGLSIAISRHYGILVKLGGWDAPTIATSAKQPDALYDLFHGKDTVLSFKATDNVNAKGEVESVRVEVWVDDEKIPFNGSFIDPQTGDVLLTSRYLRANPSVLEAGWLNFYFNDVETKAAEEGAPLERTVIKSITIDGSKAAQKIVTIDKEENQSFTMGEEYTLPVVTVTVGGEDKSNEVTKYIAVLGEEPNYETPYAATTITPDLEYIRGFKVYYVFDGKVVKTVTVANSSEIELTLSTEEITGAKANTAFTVPTVTAASIGSVDLAANEFTVKYKIGVFEYETTAGATVKAMSDETIVIGYYFYGRLVKTVNVAVAPDVAPNRDFSEWAIPTGGGTAPNWKSQKIYNNKLYLRFSLNKELAAGDMYEFTLRGGETSTGAWMNYPKGLNLRLTKDDEGKVKFLVHSDPGNSNWTTNVYGESVNSYENLNWSVGKRHNLAYSVYDKYDGNTFLGVAIEVWLDGVKVEFAAGKDGTIDTDGCVLIPAETVLANPKDTMAGRGDPIFGEAFFAIFGMTKTAVLPKGTFALHHAYIMKPTDTLPTMPEDPPVFSLDKEDGQTFVMGTPYELPVLTVTVGEDDRSNLVKVYITVGGGTPDLSADTPHTGATYTPTADDYLGFTVHYAYNNEIVKTVSVANSASVEITLETETIADAKAGTAFTVPSVTTATLSDVNVKDDVTVEIVAGGKHTPVEAGASYTPIAAGELKIVYSFKGEVVKEITVSVAEADAKLVLELSAQEVTAKIGTVLAVPTVTSATIGSQDVKDQITTKLVIGTKEITENIDAYTPWYDETIYIVYSYSGEPVKTLEVPVPPVADSKTDIAGQFRVDSGSKAVIYNQQFLYNNKVYLNFSFSEGNEYVAGDVYEFGLRGGFQDKNSNCNYARGTVLRFDFNSAFGVMIQVIYNESTMIAQAKQFYGPGTSIGENYVHIDWTKPVTMIYGAYDVYDGDNYLGIQLELTLNGSPVEFKQWGTDIGATFSGNKILIPATKIAENPVDSNSVSIFDKSLFYVWRRNAVKNITVNRAYILKPTDELPKEPIDITSAGTNTAKNAWLYYNVTPVLNRKVDLTFSLSTEENFLLMQFGLRGSETTSTGWYSNSQGLIFGIYRNATYGDLVKITYGSNEANCFAEGKRQGGADIGKLDWTQSHTVSYSVWNVYDDNDEITGIKVSVVLDGTQITFGGASELLITKEAYMEKVAAGAPVRSFEEASNVFVWSSNQATVNVSSATLLEL